MTTSLPRLAGLTALFVSLVIPAIHAQQPGPGEPLTLVEAMARAGREAASVELADLGLRQARLQVSEARAGFLPRVDVSEAWQRGDQPVFAFGSLLAQRRFTAADFDVNRLTRPDPLNNFRAAVTVEQTLFDGALRARLRMARLAHAVSERQRQRSERDAMTAAASAYGEVLRFEAMRQSAEAAEAAASADLERAERRRDAGLVTDADLLAVSVHLAEVRARRIGAAAEEQVARAELNLAMGAPLDSRFMLTPVAEVDPAEPLAGLETEALRARPDLQVAELRRELAESAVDQVRATFLPQVVFRGGLEWNGGNFGQRAQSWVIGTEIRLNVFAGLADRAQLARAAVARQTSDVRAREAADRVRLEVRAAHARVEAARATVTVAESAIDQAREGQRIVRDRYDGGLADIVAVLRAAEALLDAEAQAIAASAALTVHHARLIAAVGR
jgi:outer membrane protein TolC